MKNSREQTIFISTLIFILLFWVGSAHLCAAADPFYKKLVDEGKTLYAEGKYQEAAENFRIAEFGLMDEKEILKELYVFYSLTQFKLDKLEEAQKIMRELETELNIKDLDTLSILPGLQTDAKIMQATLQKIRGIKSRNSWKKIRDFESLFWKSAAALDNNRLDKIPGNIELLKKINKKDTRILYLNGILKFKQRKLKDCIKSLKKVNEDSLDPSLLDKNYYYLALAHYYMQDDGQALAFSQKISDQGLKRAVERLLKQAKPQEK